MRTCEVETPDGVCPRKHKARGKCKTHYMRVRREGNVRADVPIGALVPPGRPQSNDPGYDAVHKRLLVQRGRAAEHGCVDGGNQAQEWSYNHECPDERTSDDGPYSDNLARYYPRCFSCHKKFDLNRDGMEETHAPDLARTASM